MQKRKKATQETAPAATRGPHSVDITIPDAQAALSAIASEQKYKPQGYNWICGCGDPDCEIGPFTRLYKGKVGGRARILNEAAQLSCGCGSWGPMDEHGDPYSEKAARDRVSSEDLETMKQRRKEEGEW